MGNRSKNDRCLAAVLVWALFFAGPSSAAVVLNDLTNYSQDFNTLASTGTNNSWTDNVSITGWYWQGDGNGSGLGYIASDGNSDSVRRYSFGSVGSSDRAMGAITLQGLQVAYGVVFQNNSGQAISDLTVTYTGEQWRRNTAAGDAIQFSYKTSTTEVADYQPADGAMAAGWTTVPELDFGPPPPQVGLPPVALDGNAAANRETITHAFSVSVPAGQFLALRWYDGDVANTDQGSGIDDLTVSFAASNVPEASAGWLVAVACGAISLKSAGRRLLRRQIRA